ncbi:hypothetical protein INT45_005342 [Circinella minor]|uniref:Uncharacterized protein n=1 Tax=Circinella minor TaxID=1195481 RepID=A0A8H7SB59_9FUNG|nr:hypothetical protein INT45_005342 [Circinella minor]
MATPVAFSNFLHFYGIMNQRNDSFMDLVGIPCLCYILMVSSWVYELSNDDTLAENKLTIVMPHVDPGFECKWCIFDTLEPIARICGEPP